MKIVVRLWLWVGVVSVACFGLALDASASAGSSAWSAGAQGQVASLVITPLREPGHRKRQTVPEGGSALAYLALAGLSCFGAMAIRSRVKANETA